MGDKVTARQVAQDLDIPTIPGTNGPLNNLQEACDFVDTYAQTYHPSSGCSPLFLLGLTNPDSTFRHGFPVVVKASFGGECINTDSNYNQHVPDQCV